MKNNFYIVATPIGNLTEISQRAIDTFKKTQIFFSENTNVTKKLLQKLQIDYRNKKFIVCNNYNDNLATEKISNFLSQGNCALVSDSGYPMISDPGFGLWKSFEKLNIVPEIINGPCAIIHALVLSGYAINNFFFQGFLASNKSLRNNQLEKISKIAATIVLFEGVNKLLKTLNEIKEKFGNIEVCVLKELTKINEKKYKGKIFDITKQIDLRGEFVIIFENKIEQTISDKAIIREIAKIIQKNTKIKDACKIVAYKYDLKSNDLFKKWLASSQAKTL